ncbi:MAG: insulinase family protein [Muribaculaceae bacterium]|nr:insulinase family protein [Muribaculaceae bacterium]
MDKDAVKYCTLPSGLRIVHRYSDSPVEYCGVAVNVGSRDETVVQHGLAHFVEHTIFKGTARRRSWHIINRMESIGGELNAYTTKEETMLYSVFPNGYLGRALELIADLVTSSQFPETELAKEREVVADEINSYLDTPSEAIFDDYEDLLFAGSSLGHNILGSVESLSGFTSDVCRDYLDSHYTSGNMVLFYMGRTTPERLMKYVETYLSGLLAGERTGRVVNVPVNAPFDLRRETGNHQCHTVIGARLPGMYSELRYPIALLTNIVGGPGMNSLLNVSLRERRGLVYTVDASSSMFTDVGEFTIYFGCDAEDIKTCRRIVLNHLDSMASSQMPVRRLEAAKKQYLGQLTVASDNKEQMALSTARATLYHGRVATAEEITERIMAITPESLREVAELVSPSNCSILTFG